ncbi:MAG TPA: TonB-dependent receptor [Sphingobacteriaceae bacterium]
MKRILILFVAMAFSCTAFAQHSFKSLVKDSEKNEPLIGVTVSIPALDKAASTNTNGEVAFQNIAAGKYAVIFKYVGFKTRTDTVNIPAEALTVLLEEDESELDEVVITTTRSSRTIEDIPTRVEAISGEELAEKGNMKPGDIRMLLNESTGIQTQQTSATSANSSIRIQGLDGRYTQIIRDGFPLYSGFSGGLGLLQIAPLDLKQVEVIKGSSSTLYGGGAISGLVNLVSKTPGEERELSFVLNGTSALGLDASGFYSKKEGKIGTTVYAAYNYGNPYDPADIGLTAIPEFNRFTLNPKIFVDLSSRTALNFGINSVIEKRIGGDIAFVKGDATAANRYFERNNTGRYSTQLSLNHTLSDNSSLVFKNSISYYDREISIPSYGFAGNQISTFTEGTFNRDGEKAEWVAGLNFLTDKFTEDQTSNIVRDYNQNTLGAFIQNTWKPADRFNLESGIRGDYHSDYGFLLLPRLSALYKAGPVSLRLGGGLGYKTPTVFTEEAERIQFRNVLPIEIETAKAERSYGANFDVNYRTGLFDDRVTLSVNNLFFYTRINNPLVLSAVGGNAYQFEQPDGHLNTKGMETNVKLTYGDFKIFIGYTLADVKQRYGSNTSDYPLVAKHRLNNVLMYEVEEKFKFGVEAYYFSQQKLNDGTEGRSYWVTGAMAEKIWERFSVFVNFENFLDTRQSRFDTIYTGNLSNPQFRDIYAPTDGFVVNGGIKIKL